MVLKKVITLIFLLLLLNVAKAEIILANWNDAITPVAADYIKRVVDTAEKKRACVVILTLDTPGGLDTAMRDIIKSISNTPIPFVVYVYPKGARAASAGAIITVASDVAVMSPMSNIGSASPVSMEGRDIEETMKKKVINDMVAFVKSVALEKGRNPEVIEKMITESINLTAKEAVDKKVVDFIAMDINDLIDKLEGRKVKKLGKEIVLNVKNQPITEVELNFKEVLLKVLSNPTVAYFLLMIGFYGIFFELYNPGSIIPGTVGAISLALALYSLNIISVNWLGLILILLGILFFVIELITPTFGGIAIAGIISLFIGSVILVSPESPYGDISLSIIIPTVIFSALFFLIVAYLGLKAQREKPKTGEETIVGKEAVAYTDIDGQGYVMVDGELWKAISDKKIEKGKKVRILNAEGLTLKVEEV
ncbi:MAG: nodulation protein NfeD [Hydrogenothermaceae bacterium]|nr:nodulation protein NfeD [Hydrogenothermaceae bacterium]